MPYTGVEDVEVDYGSPIGEADIARVTRMITRAEAMIDQRVPDLAERITAGRTSTELVRQVVAELVANKLRNPDGFMQRSHTVTAGPFAESVAGTVAGGVAGGGGGTFTLTRRHLRLLGNPGAATTMPLADDALRYPVRLRGSIAGAEYPEGVPYGNVWPEPWDGTWR
jgi:hypothetical protein